MPGLANQAPATVVFLGAGFSCLAGVPLAGTLFDEEPVVDRAIRRRLVHAVQARWLRWHEATGGSPEEHLAELQAEGGIPWVEAVRYVGLVIALRMGELREISFRRQTQLTKHDLMRRGIPIHEAFWKTLFAQVSPIAVVTTNYDILAERGMRHQPRPRISRPGFNYGTGDGHLEGRGYPSYAHLRPITACGTIPLLKLHGSVSWCNLGDRIAPYWDCRPAIRGDALIVAPTRDKQPPKVLSEIWDLARRAISRAERVLVVGYSLPTYDGQVLELLRQSPPDCRFEIFDPAPGLDARYAQLLHRQAIQHPGLPDGVQSLELEQLAA